MWFPILITFLAGYLLGNLNGAVCISALYAHEDVRNRGSGNAGLTNFVRNFGFAKAGLVVLIDIVKAFLVGGIICAVGQVLIDYTKLTPARILTGFVVLGVILSALGIYKPVVDFAGAGATVPLTGFGHLLAEGVRKAVDEDGFIGVLTGGLKSASGGITASLVFGFIAALVFRQKDK